MVKIGVAYIYGSIAKLKQGFRFVGPLGIMARGTHDHPKCITMFHNMAHIGLINFVGGR